MDQRRRPRAHAAARLGAAGWKPGDPAGTSGLRALVVGCQHSRLQTNAATCEAPARAPSRHTRLLNAAWSSFYKESSNPPRASARQARPSLTMHPRRASASQAHHVRRARMDSMNPRSACDETACASVTRPSSSRSSPGISPRGSSVSTLSSRAASAAAVPRAPRYDALSASISFESLMALQFTAITGLQSGVTFSCTEDGTGI